MSRNVIIILVVVAVLVIAGGVGFWVINNNDSQESTAQLSSESEEGSTTQGSFASITTSGKAQQCDMEYSGANGSGTGTIYTDGNGRGRYTFSSTTEQGNSGETNQIIVNNVSYGWFQSGSETIGFKTDLSTTTESSNSTTSTTTSTSTSSAPDPNQEFSMNCQSWNVDESMFELPAGVNFLDANALNPAALPTSE